MVEISVVDKEIRHMPASQVLDLCNILDCDDGWKALMSIIRDEDKPPSLKYTMEHIRLIENAGDKQRRSCSEILFEEWGTSGKIRPKYSSLLQYLMSCQLYRAAEYVHYQLLRNVEELKRPMEGPAAKVDIPSFTDVPCQKNSLDVTLVNETQPCSHTTCGSSRPIISLTVPVAKLGEYPKEFKYSDLSLWTDGFSKHLGHGAFGSVYLCDIPDPKSQVAVKRLEINNSCVPLNQLPKQFYNELTTLTMFKHENVLPLLGFSYDGPELCLIYSYMPNGSLEDKIKVGCENLDWNIRLQISCGTAEGIAYLHTVAEKPHIHRDIKSANILLDENLNPKLGDFGLARPDPMETIATTTIVGTTAYMSPEALRGDISVKMDVYSFGVVLVEIVTGLLAWDEDREYHSLVSFIDEIEDITSLIDGRPEKYEPEIALRMFNVAQECLLDKKHLRPSIQKVLELLNGLNSVADNNL